MSLKIARVLAGSIAEKEGISSEDKILSINGNRINDFLGLHFYCSDPKLEFILESPDGTIKSVSITQDWQSKLGIEPEEYQIKECSNHCIFCFIDQMPPKLRSSLYVKDDDYLFSFIYGNYISLNNLAELDLQRIVKERISPLYVSVHATDPVVRKKIMRSRSDSQVLDLLSYLSRSGISFHTQIVLMPGVNDGAILEKTIIDLTKSEMNTLSIGLVPVGLTRYRQNLYPLKSITSEDARAIIKMANDLSKQIGFSNIYCADELFLLAQQEIPPITYYDDFCQIENGIGMVRALLENWKKKRRRFINYLGDQNILLVTGRLAEKYLDMISRSINHSTTNEIAQVLAVDNNFFGESVTVSGLLTFADVWDELKKLDLLPEIIAFSSNMFNSEGQTIDGVNQAEIKQILNRKILIVNELWTDWALV